MHPKACIEMHTEKMKFLAPEVSPCSPHSHFFPLLFLFYFYYRIILLHHQWDHYIVATKEVSVR